MATIWKTLVASLSLVDGQRRDPSPEIGAIEAGDDLPPGSVHKGNLYLLCELSAPAMLWDEASSQIVDLAIQSFYETTGSVTASLRQAILTANRFLVEGNAKALAGQEVWAGMTCMALREHDLFITQGGPALVHVWHHKNLLRFPDTADSPEGASLSQPLGEILSPDIQIFHCTVDAGDCFLLSASHLPYLIPSEQVAKMLNELAPGEILKQIETRVGKRDFSALAVRLIEAQSPTGTAAPMKRPVISIPEALPDVSGVHPFKPAESSHQPDVPVAQEPLPPTPDFTEAGADEEEWDTRPAQSGLLLARILEVGSVFMALVFRALAGLVGQIGSLGGFAGHVIGPVLENVGRMVVNTLLFLGSRFLYISRQMLPGVEASAPKPRQTQARPQKTRHAGISIPLVLVGLLVPALMIALAAGFWFRQTETRKARVQTLITQGTKALKTAPSEPRDQAQKMLIEAIKSVKEARRLDPKVKEADKLLTDLANALDDVNRVSRLSGWTTLDTFTAPPGVVLHRLLLNKDSLFVLDVGLDRVIRYPRDTAAPGAGQTILQIGQDESGQTVGELADIAWVEPGSGRTAAGLLVLTQDRQLFEVTAGGTVRNDNVVQTDSWKAPRRIDTFTGNFYVLDAAPPEIYKYAPTPEGSYALPPQAWFQKGQDEIQNPLDMAIDGDIYVLTDKGKVSKFTAGEVQDFPMDGLDTPVKPLQGTIFADPDGQFVYVGDPAANRIVVFDKQGHFVRQLQTSQDETGMLSSLVSLVVDEAQGQIYLLDSQNLSKAVVPHFAR